MTQKYFDSDILFKRFNSFIVLKIEPKTTNQRQVLTVCDCGSTAIRPLYRVASGSIKTCSACKKGFIKISKNPLYEIWRGIKARCFCTTDTGYKNYGGRGISMYKEWINNAPAFIEYCSNNGWAKGLQVDRIDNSGNYEPGNIRFVTAQVNCSNTRRNKYCMLDGVKMTLSEASRSLGRSRDYLSSIQTRRIDSKPFNVVFCE
jgi:hypothetical protein